ncbi:MAG: metal ABC transporter substrate-binding protein [Planctomycetota bacterium]|nr:metal ABC transporter substrate-binding protein [Planctomycetota bacterium]
MRLLISVLIALPSICLGSAIAQNPMSVIATTPDLGDVVQTIGGDLVEVSMLVPGAVDPHNVLPKASMLIKLKRADALFSMGLGYEHAFLPALLEKVSREDFGRGSTDLSQGGTRHLVGSDFIGRPLDIPTKLDRGDGVDVHPLGSPHWNTNPKLMRKFAVGARDFLIKLLPDHQKQITSNWQEWDHRAGRLINHWDLWLAPIAGEHFVSYHRSWSYFADCFKIQSIGEIEPKPGMPPTTKHLAKLAREMNSAEVKLLLIEPWYSESKLGNLPRLTNIKTVKQASCSAGEGYLEWMSSLVADVAAAWEIPEPPQEYR